MKNCGDQFCVYITYCKTELHAILGEFLLIHRLVPPQLRGSTRDIIWSDSESSFDKLSAIHGTKQRSHKENLTAEFPIIADINHLCKPCLDQKLPKS